MEREKSIDYVTAFLENLARIKCALIREYPEFSSLEAVLRAVRAGTIGRSAETLDGFTYSVHGRGCLMTGPSGEEVDIDLLASGFEAFDVWRLHRFARSVGGEVLPERIDLLTQCRELVRIGYLREPQDEWFCLAE
ncbi:DUF6896 domain-containing protein [Streptomyces sp. NPDC060027]|uniref:DUF6896 domain-containing protein n=1 Tax=Streptomyces sp. NPDC060027 TaxID=3347040 RepID=UPI003694BF9A